MYQTTTMAISSETRNRRSHGKQGREDGQKHPSENRGRLRLAHEQNQQISSTETSPYAMGTSQYREPPPQALTRIANPIILRRKKWQRRRWYHEECGNDR
jgi:hypothetical protein